MKPLQQINEINEDIINMQIAFFSLDLFLKLFVLIILSISILLYLFLILTIVNKLTEIETNKGAMQNIDINK